MTLNSHRNFPKSLVFCLSILSNISMGQADQLATPVNSEFDQLISNPRQVDETNRESAGKSPVLYENLEDLKLSLHHAPNYGKENQRKTKMVEKGTTEDENDEEEEEDDQENGQENGHDSEEEEDNDNNSDDDNDSGDDENVHDQKKVKKSATQKKLAGLYIKMIFLNAVNIKSNIKDQI